MVTPSFGSAPGEPVAPRASAIPAATHKGFCACSHAPTANQDSEIVEAPAIIAGAAKNDANAPNDTYVVTLAAFKTQVALMTASNSADPGIVSGTTSAVGVNPPG